MVNTSTGTTALLAVTGSTVQDMTAQNQRSSRACQGLASNTLSPETNALGLDIDRIFTDMTTVISATDISSDMTMVVSLVLTVGRRSTGIITTATGMDTRMEAMMTRTEGSSTDVLSPGCGQETMSTSPFLTEGCGNN